MTIYTILIVDDDKVQRKLCSGFIEKTLGYNTEEAEDGKQALARLMDVKRPSIDIVLLDIYMPMMDGKETLKHIRHSFPALPVIMLTSESELDSAVSLMRLGASDFITKPFLPERLRLAIDQHITIRTLTQELARLKRKENGCGQFSDLITAGGLNECITMARKASQSDIAVFISGESGVGKELLACAIHGESHRSGKPFVAINCGAIPENLVESTLFGHEKGAFTGAIAREIGKFREADGGTLLLDEVGELKPDIQTKLLRVLQEKEIAPVGAGRPTKVNVRIIAATHRNLAKEVERGAFRQDLYYRLNVLPIHMPPLRERSSDIPLLAEHILARLCITERKSVKTIAQNGVEWLIQQAWPGNVRELENLLYRLVVISEKEELDAEEFAKMNAYAHAGQGQKSSEHYIMLLDAAGRTKTMDELENEIIAATLHRSGNNIAETAKLLSVGQSTLYKKRAEKHTA